MDVKLLKVCISTFFDWCWSFWSFFISVLFRSIRSNGKTTFHYW